MSTISNNDIARAIYLSLKDKSSAEAHKMHKNIIEFLVRKRLMQRTFAILHQLTKIINLEDSIVSATVLSAHRIHEKDEKNVVHFLKKRYSAKGVALTHVLDKALLGGMRLEASDEVIDLSFKNKIRELQEYLTRSNE